MKIILIILGYLKWHYGKAIRSLTNIWSNLFTFIFNFFSLNLLFRNFFDPWKRMTDDYPIHFSLKNFFFTLITNIITRLVGIILRFILIIIGLTVCVLFILSYPLALLIWILSPAIILILLGISFYLILS